LTFGFHVSLTDMIGELLGSYRVLKLIGEGGMGRVYLAEHTLIGKHVAIKVLLPQFCNNPSIVSRFFNEARATAQIKHPSLIEIYDFGHHPSGSAFIVMELLEGESLTRRLQAGGPMTQAMVIDLSRQVATALQAAHAKGIVHRDLKPDNVFLLPEPELPAGVRAKVLDFGIAKLADEGSSSIKTRTGALMGTPAYMSPEQCRGAGAVDLRTDVYSLGCMMFEMLSGQSPFVGEGPGDVIAMHLYQPAPSLAAIAPGMDPLLQRMLAKKPAERLQSMAEVLAALDGLARAHSGSGGFRAAALPTVRMDSVVPPTTTLGGAAAEVRNSQPGTSSGGGAPRTLVAFGAGLVALAIGVGIWGMRLRSNAPADSPTETAAAALPAPAPAKVAPAPIAPAVAPAPAPAKKITLKLESQPDGASVYRDGELLGTTPFDELRAPQSRETRYVLKLAGYRDAQVSLPGDRDGERTVTLSRAAAPHAPEAHKPAARPAAKPEAAKPAAKPVKNGVLDPFDN